MKKLAILVPVVLSGCSIINALQMAKYDPSEYALITSLSSIAEIGNDECKDPAQMKITSSNLLMKATEFKNHAENLQNNDESIKMSKEIYTMVKGLTDRYSSGNSVSVAYCTNKMAIIERTSKTIQFSVGTKPR